MKMTSKKDNEKNGYYDSFWHPGDKDPFEGGGGNQGAQYLRDSIIMQYLPIFEDFREVYLQSLLRWIIKDKY